MSVEESIRNDANRLNQISTNISYSQARKVVYDFFFLAMLLEVAGIRDIYADINFRSLDDGENIVYAMEDNLGDVEKLANRVLAMFKKINFYCYYDSGYQTLSTKDRTDVLYDFLDKFLPDLLRLYKELYNSEHIFLADTGDALGQSYILQHIDSYYVAINSNQYSDINNLETIIHELLHVYSMRFLRDYGWKKSQSLLNGLSAETIPLYGELAFFDYLVKNNILKESAYFHRNSLDGNILEFFKIIKYFCYFGRKEKDQLYFPDGLTYEYRGESTLELYKGLPFLSFNDEELRKSDLVNFAYGIGSVEAYNLLSLERRGATPRDIVNGFLINQSNSDHLEKSVFNTDLSFMSCEIQKTQKVLEKVRPIPGYHILK